MELFGNNLNGPKKSLQKHDLVKHENGCLPAFRDNDSSVGVNMRDENNSDEFHFLKSQSEFAANDNFMQSIAQSTGNVSCWLKTWMHIISLPSANSTRYAYKAVQTIGQTLEDLMQVAGASELIYWLNRHFLQFYSSEEQFIIPVISAVLNKANPPLLDRAQIILRLIKFLNSSTKDSYLVLEHVSKMGLEDMTVVSPDVVITLNKLIEKEEFSPRAIKVAAQLALSNSDAEKVLLSILRSPQIFHAFDTHSLNLCVNALCLLVTERADVQLFEDLFKAIGAHPQVDSLLPLFCSNLDFACRFGLYSRLSEALDRGLTCVHDSNDLKWQLCSLIVRDPSYRNWQTLLNKLSTANDHFLISMVIHLAGQHPLPGFDATQWSSLNVDHSETSNRSQNSDVFVTSGEAILNFENNSGNVWSRTVFGRHCYSIKSLSNEIRHESPVDQWIQHLSAQDKSKFQRRTSGSRSLHGENLIDPFHNLPRPTPRSYPAPGITKDQIKFEPELDVSVQEMLAFIQNTSREPEPLPQLPDSSRNLQANEKFKPMDLISDQKSRSSLKDWRKFVADFEFVSSAKSAHANFTREIKHLDATLCREVHKVAVIYVAEDQDDKQSILSNNSASDSFNVFVAGLGWPVQIGSSNFHGYTGGLSSGRSIYFCSSNTELIFHVSTWLNGDITQRLKHLGNDEVHVVWSENSKAYRRDMIATRFCDILIVLYTVSPVLIRVNVEVQDPRIQFGPLFDGACIHIKQASCLIRETVLNASRAYRRLRSACDRPNKHREKVFDKTSSQLGYLPLAHAITRLYSPLMNSSQK